MHLCAFLYVLQGLEFDLSCKSLEENPMPSKVTKATRRMNTVTAVQRPSPVPVSAAAHGAPPKLLTVQGCAALTGESAWTWRARAYSGRCESVKMRGPKSRLLIPESEVFRLIQEGRRPRATA